jgi:hypothetical protein
MELNISCKEIRQMRKAATIFASTVGVLALAGGVAFAVVPGPVPEPDGTIHMCYNKTNGSIIKVVTPSTGMDCSGSEGKVIWNQVGPQGAPGPAGATGPQGPAGEDATSIPLNNQVYYVSGSPVTLSPGQAASAVAECGEGDRAINGSSFVNWGGDASAFNDVVMVMSTVTGSYNTGWSVWSKNTSATTSRSVTVQAVCLDTNEMVVHYGDPSEE